MRYKKLTRVYHNGELVGEFESQEKAAQVVGHTTTYISKLAKTGETTKKGYRFEVIETDIPFNYKKNVDFVGFREVRTCEGCGKHFVIRSPYARSKKYCGELCRDRAKRNYKKESRHREKIKKEMEVIVESKSKVEPAYSVNQRAIDNGIHYGYQVAIDERKKWPLHTVIDGKVVETGEYA